jgi:hypothetical protein
MPARGREAANAAMTLLCQETLFCQEPGYARRHRGSTPDESFAVIGPATLLFSHRMPRKALLQTCALGREIAVAWPLAADPNGFADQPKALAELKSMAKNGKEQVPDSEG